jgi:hypothetical protein
MGAAGTNRPHHADQGRLEVVDGDRVVDLSNPWRIEVAEDKVLSEFHRPADAAQDCTNPKEKRALLDEQFVEKHGEAKLLGITRIIFNHCSLLGVGAWFSDSRGLKPAQRLICS